MPPASKSSINEGEKGSKRAVPKKPGQKRTRSGCAHCRAKRHKCDEQKPSCSRCVRSGTECLWPLEVPRQALFQPYGKQEPVQPTASTSYLPPAPSNPSHHPTPSSSSSSSSRTPPNGRRPTSASAPPLPTPSDSAARPPPSAHGLQVSLYTEPTSSLEITFPDPQERFIAHNFLSLMNHLRPVDPHSPAVPSSAEPQTIGQIFPQLDLHRILSSRGTSIASEALILAFLSVGSVQLSYLHHQSAVRFHLDANTVLSSSSHDNNRRFTTLGNTLYESSLGLIRASIAMLDVKGGALGVGGREEVTMETLNTAASFLLLNRTLGGGAKFEEALAMSKSLVGLGGGPRRMLEDARNSGDKRRLRRVRTSLEHLVGYDLFSCLSSTRPPDCSFPAEGNTSNPLASWYFDFAPMSNAPRTISSEDFETVESLMGVSRGMIEILNRINTLYSVSRPASRDAPIDEVWLREGGKILDEVARWGSAFKDTQLVQYGSRLDYGNLIYAAFFKIIIYLDIYRYPIWNPDVVWASNEIVRLLHEFYSYQCHRSNGYLMGYMMPLCWAGSIMSGAEERTSVRKAMNYFRPLVCYTVEKAWETLEKVWARMDEGDKSASWRSVASEAEGGGLLLV